MKALRIEMRQFIDRSEEDRSLMEPDQVCARLAVLDRLDAWFPNHAHATNPEANSLENRARILRDRLEAANRSVYTTIRAEIRRGAQPEILLHCIQSCRSGEGNRETLRNPGYDDLDELIAGILGFDAPDDEAVRPEPEKVLYQPTPARLIYNLLQATALTEKDVLVDLGSGLGHVPLLAAICTSARSIGIELEAPYVIAARQCADCLNLSRVEFIQQDAREADVSTATVFYLYTPFSGSILRRVLDRLRDEALKRKLRVCTYGPCTATVAKETWLTPMHDPDENQITIFSN